MVCCLFAPGQPASGPQLIESSAGGAQRPVALGIPRAVFEHESYDFGFLWAWPDRYVGHTFVLANEGDAPLEILAVVRLVVGTAPDPYAGMILQPGERLDLPFKMKSMYLAGAREGRFSKGVMVRTDDPLRPEIRLAMTGVALPYVDAPRMIGLGTVRADTSKTQRGRIINHTNRPLKLAFPSPDACPDPVFDFELVEVEPGCSYELVVRTVPPMSAGRHNSEVTVLTSIPEQPELSIPLSVHVPPRILIRPDLVVYDPRRLTLPVTLVNYGPTRVHVLSATTDDPALDVEVIEMEAGKFYTVKVTFPKHYEPSAPTRTLTITTDDLKEPVFTVPIQTRASEKRRRPAEALVEQPAPGFAITTVAGKSIDNEAVANCDAVVLIFWAADCPSSRKALPRIDAVREKFAGANVRFVYVAQTLRKLFSVPEIEAAARAFGIGGELAADPRNRIGPSFKVTSYPTLFVLRRNTTIQSVIIGNIAELEAELTAELTRLTEARAAPP